MPLLSIKVPAYVKENIPETLDDQVTAMGGYIEQNLHISIASIDYNPENEELFSELISGIEKALQTYIPNKIHFVPLQKISKYYFGAPVNNSSNQALEQLFDSIKEVVTELQKKFGKDSISLVDWKPYHAHLSLYGQVTEELILPEKNYSSLAEFIPTCILLRNNESIIHQFKNGLKSENLKQKADEIFNEATTNFLNFKQGQSGCDFMTIRQQFALGCHNLIKSSAYVLPST